MLGWVSTFFLHCRIRVRDTSITVLEPHLMIRFFLSSTNPTLLHVKPVNADASRASSSRPGINYYRGIFIFPLQLTTSRIGNLTRLVHTLLLCDGHTYTQQSMDGPGMVVNPALGEITREVNVFPVHVRA